ncbi:unnamed protein product [Amoebophrya sp. A25]|nr:unnamed protein product [Amoebophrya sp. A25]|eukprot:GSA25T00002293001.1
MAAFVSTMIVLALSKINQTLTSSVRLNFHELMMFLFSLMKQKRCKTLIDSNFGIGFGSFLIICIGCEYYTYNISGSPETRRNY